MKILLVEDDRDLQNTIRNFLVQEKYVVECASDRDEALDKIGVYDYDCVLLDIMLPGGSGLTVLEELKKVMKQAIEALPPSYREAFVMHRFQQMSYKEIADQLHVSSKTVDYRIQQALKQLRTDLKDYLPLLILLSLN